MQNLHIKDHAPTGYRPDIDGLRAIAVLSVVIFHAFPSLLPGGFVGVDIFFVISGYLISSILFKEFSANRFSYLEFYSRRARRILPSLLLMLWAGFIAGWFLLLADEYQSFGKHVFASSFFVQNLILIKESNYFDISSNLKPLLHIWSLAVEEQFYLIWPVLIGLFYKRKSGFLKVILGVVLVSFLLNILRIQRFPASTFYAPYSRFWELMIGALLAYLHSHGRFKLQNPLPAILGILLIASGFIFIRESNAFPGWWAILPVFGAGLIIATTQSASVNRLLSARVMVWMGLISYPLYLWHWIFLSFLRILSPEAYLDSTRSVPIKIAAVALSFVFAYGCYRLLETPIRKSHSRKLAIWITALLFVTGFAGYAISVNHGFPNRKAAMNADVIPSPQPTLSDCDPSIQFSTVEWCKTNTAKLSADVVAIGDSHALMYSDELARYYQQKGRSFHVFGTGDSLGLYHAGSKVGGGVSVNGIRSIDKAFDWSIQNQAKTVILISRGPAYLGSSKKVSVIDLSQPDHQDDQTIYENLLDRTFTLLENHGIEIVFIFDNPDLTYDPKRLCLKRPVDLFESQRLATCGIERKKVDQWQDLYRGSVANVLAKHPKVKTFDPQPILCDIGFCYGMKDQNLLYRDSNHLTRDGVRFLSRSFNF